MSDDRCAAPDAVPPDPLLRVPSYLIVEMAKLIRRTSAELYPSEAVRLPHALALAWLADRGPMSQRELSDRLRSDPGDLVGVLDQLERLGYVLRRRDPADRRRHALELTKAGRRALHERRSRGQRLNEALFEPLDPAERDQLQALLLKVLAHHDERFAAARRTNVRPAPPPTADAGR